MHFTYTSISYLLTVFLETFDLEKISKNKKNRINDSIMKIQENLLQLETENGLILKQIYTGEIIRVNEEYNISLYKFLNTTILGLSYLLTQWDNFYDNSLKILNFSYMESELHKKSYIKNNITTYNIYLELRNELIQIKDILNEKISDDGFQQVKKKKFVKKQKVLKEYNTYTEFIVNNQVIKKETKALW
jgi:hypothetical protein